MLETIYPFLKSLHIIGFVSWFAGLFYLVRIFVYYVEADGRPEAEQKLLQEQFGQMQWRVYRIICNPAMMITWTAGILMLLNNGMDWLKGNPWMHIKLTLLVLLLGYHLYCKRIIRKLEKGERPFSSFGLRLFNEVPTLFLVTIVILAVYRNNLNYLYLIGGLAAFGLLMFLGARAYRKRRQQKEA